MNAIFLILCLFMFCMMLGLFHIAVKTLSVNCLAFGALMDMMLCAALLQDGNACPVVLLGSLACVAVVFHMRKKACAAEKE